MNLSPGAQKLEPAAEADRQKKAAAETAQKKQASLRRICGWGDGVSQRPRL